jgi:hypothetical protein
MIVLETSEKGNRFAKDIMGRSVSNGSSYNSAVTSRGEEPPRYVRMVGEVSHYIVFFVFQKRFVAKSDHFLRFFAFKAE